MANLLSMYTRTRFFLFLMAIGGLLAACRGNSNEQLLEINEMKVIVWDMLKADELYTVQQAKDSSLRKQKRIWNITKRFLPTIKLADPLFISHSLIMKRIPWK